MEESIVIAIGGNAIIKEKQKGTFEEQMANIAESMENITELVKKGYRIVITHGNGPQVGNLLIQNEMAKEVIPAQALDICVAETQGQIGSMIELSLKNKMLGQNSDVNVSCVLTHVEVDAKDDAFNNPTKPVGPFYSNEEAESLIKEKGYVMVEDSGRGYRRVVASPMPVNILEARQIKTLLADNIVIAAGGGGIPVTVENNNIKGVQAVIDKDLASAVLASQIHAEKYIILTGVPQVYVNFGKENQKAIGTMTVTEAKAYTAEGQFPAGSMLPKIKAAIMYLELGGKEVIITEMGSLAPAVYGLTGTRIVNG
jgi:carbamate kinase